MSGFKKFSAPAASGFTLIELMVVTVIIGILLSIGTVHYQSLVRKADEGALQGNLGTLRSALSIYYGDLEGQYPSTLDALTINPKYLTAVPVAKIPTFHLSSLVTLGATASDAGGWGFNSDPYDAHYGSSWINCTHTDSKGAAWSSY